MAIFTWQAEHYKKLFERADKEANWNKAKLFEAWTTMAGQTRGLQRQRRLIKRLQAENARLRHDITRSMANHVADINAACSTNDAATEQEKKSHRGIGWGSQYCTDNDCRCHGHARGKGPYMHYVTDAAEKP